MQSEDERMIQAKAKETARLEDIKQILMEEGADATQRRVKLLEARLCHPEGTTRVGFGPVGLPMGGEPEGVVFNQKTDMDGLEHGTIHLSRMLCFWNILMSTSFRRLTSSPVSMRWGKERARNTSNFILKFLVSELSPAWLNYFTSRLDLLLARTWKPKVLSPHLLKPKSMRKRKIQELVDLSQSISESGGVSLDLPKESDPIWKRLRDLQEKDPQCDELENCIQARLLDILGESETTSPCISNPGTGPWM